LKDLHSGLSFSSVQNPVVSPMFNVKITQTSISFIHSQTVEQSLSLADMLALPTYQSTKFRRDFAFIPPGTFVIDSNFFSFHHKCIKIGTKPSSLIIFTHGRQLAIDIASQGLVDIPHSIAIKCMDLPEGALSQTVSIGIIRAGAPVAFPGM
jgi:hypothetical protein